MSIVTSKTIIKPNPILWLVGDDFALLKQTHRKTHLMRFENNLAPHITPQESHGLDQEKENNFLESNDMGDKLPHKIFDEGMKMPSSNLSNSLSTFLTIRGGIEATIAQFPTPSLKQPTKKQQPPFWIINYWGALT